MTTTTSQIEISFHKYPAYGKPTMMAYKGDVKSYIYIKGDFEKYQSEVGVDVANIELFHEICNCCENWSVSKNEVDRKMADKVTIYWNGRKFKMSKLFWK